MSKILSIIAVPLSVLIGLKYFGIYDSNAIIPFDVTLLGALLLIGNQVFTYVTVHADKGSTFMGKIIITVLAIPGILYVVNIFYPLNLGFNLEIVVALFLFTEGIYGLH